MGLQKKNKLYLLMLSVSMGTNPIAVYASDADFPLENCQCIDDDHNHEYDHGYCPNPHEYGHEYCSESGNTDPSDLDEEYDNKVTETRITETSYENTRFTQDVTIEGNKTVELKGNIKFDCALNVSAGNTLEFKASDNPSKPTVITFGKGAIIEGSTVNVPAGVKFTIPVGQTLKLDSGTTFNVEGDDDVTLQGLIDLKGGSTAHFKQVTLEGGITVDPSLFHVTGLNRINTRADDVTAGTLTLGSSAGDTHNVLLIDPNSSLSVENKVILHNKNALIIGYKASSLTQQALTHILITNKMEDGADSTKNKSFDELWTLALNDDGSSTGILQPSDATVTTTHGTFKFEFVQTSSGVQLRIIPNSEETAGSDVNEIIQEYLSKNSAFKNFVNYDESASSYNVRSSNIVNALSGAIDAAKSGISNTARIKDMQDDFRFKPVRFSRNQDAVSRAESIFKALSDNGPVSVTSDQYRIWISPFTHHSNSTGAMAGREWLIGSLVGAEYRDLKSQYTIGLVGGGNFGHTREKIQAENNTHFTGIDIGAYASYGAWEGGRIDATYLRSINNVTQSRMTDIKLIAKNNHKMTIDMIDTQTSHLFKLPGDQWSVRLNAGHFYTNEKSDGYTETGAEHRNIQVSDSHGKSYEVYGGVGLRWSCKGETWRTRITAVYEYGKEYQKSGSMIRRSHGSALNVHTSRRPDATKLNTHYATLYTTFNDTSGWKFFLGYNGSYAKGSVATGFSMKFEKRF